MTTFGFNSCSSTIRRARLSVEGLTDHGSNLAIRNNELAFNNTVNYDCGWECGGAKFAGGPGQEVQDLVFAGNYVHDNYGPGVWCDINCYHPIVTNNTINDNKQTNPLSGYQTGLGFLVPLWSTRRRRPLFVARLAGTWLAILSRGGARLGHEGTAVHWCGAGEGNIGHVAWQSLEWEFLA